jgi:hypothetical protein
VKLFDQKKVDQKIRDYVDEEKGFGDRYSRRAHCWLLDGRKHLGYMEDLLLYVLASDEKNDRSIEIASVVETFNMLGRRKHHGVGEKCAWLNQQIKTSKC